MTTNNISIQDLVQREVIYCISSLIHTLTKDNKQGDTTFKYLCPEDNQYYWGVKTEHSVWKIDPIHNDEETAIYEWFEVYRGGSLHEYRQEIFEHWIVTSWLGKKLQEQGETVVEDVLGISFIWCRATTGQAIYMDYVIQEIYNDLCSN